MTPSAEESVLYMRELCLEAAFGMSTAGTACNTQIQIRLLRDMHSMSDVMAWPGAIPSLLMKLVIITIFSWGARALGRAQALQSWG